MDNRDNIAGAWINFVHQGRGRLARDKKALSPLSKLSFNFSLWLSFIFPSKLSFNIHLGCFPLLPKVEFITIHQPVLLVEFTEGTVSLHLSNDGVDKGEEIILTLAHQHTDFAVGEWCV